MDDRAAKLEEIAQMFDRLGYHICSDHVRDAAEELAGSDERKRRLQGRPEDRILCERGTICGRVHHVTPPTCDSHRCPGRARMADQPAREESK